LLADLISVPLSELGPEDPLTADVSAITNTIRCLLARSPPREMTGVDACPVVTGTVGSLPSERAGSMSTLTDEMRNGQAAMSVVVPHTAISLLKGERPDNALIGLLS
jgi:hypothetical protein